MTEAELEAELTDLYGTTPEADRAVHRILAVADCPSSRRQVLAAVESGIAVAEFMAGVAAAQKRGEGKSEPASDAHRANGRPSDALSAVRRRIDAAWPSADLTREQP